MKKIPVVVVGELVVVVVVVVVTLTVIQLWISWPKKTCTYNLTLLM